MKNERFKFKRTIFAKLFGVKAPFSSKVIAQNPKRNGVGNTKIELKISNEPHSLIVQQVTRGQGPDGWGDVLVPSVYQPPRSLVSDLLSTANLSRQRPLSCLLHPEAEGGWVPPPGRVLLREVPGHGVGLDAAPDLLLMGVY